jgi:hypothetical protein
MRQATGSVMRADSMTAADAVLAPNARAALVVAHPGHELRLHAWLAQVRPEVHVLTDGAGSLGTSRVASTASVLGDVGARAGGIFGRWSDRALYTAILDHDHAPFLRLADELAERLVASDVDHVVGDAAEGYNPGHDACRLVIDCAVARTGRAIVRWDFTLVGRPDEAIGPGEIARLPLAPADVARKLTVAEGYPDLVGEVDHARRTWGDAAFQHECLRRLENDAPWAPADGVVPFYEQFGEYQVAAGAYARVLRHREHMLPLAEALAAHAR